MLFCIWGTQNRPKYRCSQKNTHSGDGGVSFWNPCTGDVFVASHKQSPLIDIGCILTAENIFANIQGDTSPHLLSYNVKDSSIWRPFFQDPSAQRDDWCIGCSCVCNPGPSRISRPATLASIQDLHLRYDAPNIVHAEQIQVKLTEEIKVRPIICLSVSEYIKFCAEISPSMAYEFREPSLCKHFFQC